MDQLLTINDLINGVLHNYDVFKNGSGEKREIVLGAAPGPSSSESTGAICLIDLDYDPPADPSTGGSSSLTSSSNSKPAQQQQPVADLLGDLASLDFSSSGSSSAPKPAASSGLSDIDQLFKGPLSGANSASTQDAKEGVYRARALSLIYMLSQLYSSTRMGSRSRCSIALMRLAG